MRSQEKVILVLVLQVFIAGCNRFFPNNIADPAPTLTPLMGFLDIDPLVTSEFLRKPSLSSDGRFLAVGNSINRDVDIIDTVFVIELATEQTIFKTEDNLWSSLALAPSGGRVAVAVDVSNLSIIDVLSGEEIYNTQGGNPAWSLDSTKIAFVYVTGDPSAPDSRTQIRVLDLASGTESVEYEINSGSESIHELTWSQDQKKIAFTMIDERSMGRQAFPDLYVLDLVNETIQRLSQNQWAISPNFFPDSNKIIYYGIPEPTLFDSKGYIYVVKLDGNCHRLASPIPDIQSITLSSGMEKTAIATYTRGVVVADTNIAFGNEFWQEGVSCEDSS